MGTYAAHVVSLTGPKGLRAVFPRVLLSVWDAVSPTPLLREGSSAVGTATEYESIPLVPTLGAMMKHRGVLVGWSLTRLCLAMFLLPSQQ